jgi:membrane protein implicated in regulation of membrane protease activity
MKPLLLAAIAIFCAACWYVAFCYPMWMLAVFAFSWGSVLVADVVASFQTRRDQRRRAKAERVELPEMRWIN